MSNDADAGADAADAAAEETAGDEQEAADEQAAPEEQVPEEEQAPGDESGEGAASEPVLSERVREAAGDDLGDEVAELESRVADLEAELAETEEQLAEAEAEVADLTERLQTKQADFQNYKQRAKRRQEELQERATEDLVERLLDVRDNLDRALDQEGDGEAIREGVELTREEFDRVLESEGVAEFRPEPGDEVDATRHEVMMRVESDQPEGTVADVYRSGYEMGGTVLRTAQVTVSDDE